MDRLLYGFVSAPSEVKPHLVSSSTPSSRADSAAVFANASIFYNGVGYCSLSEAVCGTLLELFVPHFKIQPGQTFQVPVGNGSSVDFLVHEVLLEYHGLRFQAERGRYGDFNGRQEYVTFQRRLRQVRGNRYKRQQLMTLTREQLLRNYYERRRRLIDRCAEHQRRELVVASCCDEFYDQIIRRFNRNFCPNRSEFRQIFYALVKVVARENAASRQLMYREKERA